jgi:hypothetical protein
VVVGTIQALAVPARVPLAVPASFSIGTLRMILYSRGDSIADFSGAWLACLSVGGFLLKLSTFSLIILAATILRSQYVSALRLLICPSFLDLLRQVPARP